MPGASKVFGNAQATMGKVLSFIQVAGWAIIAGWALLRLGLIAQQYQADRRIPRNKSDALLVCLLALLALRCWAIDLYWVTSASMEPTLLPRDVVLVLKRPLWRSPAQIGDIVIFDDPTGRKGNLVKRIGSATEYGPPTAKSDEYFVFGDNRSNSMDSRAFGPVSSGSIRGRALAIIFPLSRAKWLP
jgi:signal peptidase I